jgi:hypothetical protein
MAGLNPEIHNCTLSNEMSLPFLRVHVVAAQSTETALGFLLHSILLKVLLIVITSSMEQSL